MAGEQATPRDQLSVTIDGFNSGLCVTVNSVFYTRSGVERLIEFLRVQATLMISEEKIAPAGREALARQFPAQDGEGSS